MCNCPAFVGVGGDGHPIEGTDLVWPFDLYEDYHHNFHIIDATTRVVLSDAYAYDGEFNDKKLHEERMMVIVRALNRQLGPVVVTP